MTVPSGAATVLKAHVWEREEHEHYVEPHWCSKRLFDVENFDGLIHDPCCGFGRVLDSALAAGHGVIAGDIVDRGYSRMFKPKDYLAELNGGIYNVVCNPPFDQFQEFYRQAAANHAPKIAMIWLVARLNAARWLQETPLSRVHLLTPRPSMPPGRTIAAGEKPGGGTKDFCWLVWERGHAGPAEVRWLHRDREKQAA